MVAIIKNNRLYVRNYGVMAGGVDRAGDRMATGPLFGPVSQAHGVEELHSLLVVPRAMWDRNGGEPELLRLATRKFSSIPWKKKIPKAVFRGWATGDVYTEHTWNTTARARLAIMSNQYPHLLDAGIIDNWVQVTEGGHREMELGRVFKPEMSMNEQMQYMANVNVDGNANADRYLALLAGSSAVYKQESPLWEVFEHGLQPWVHYVPS